MTIRPRRSALHIRPLLWLFTVACGLSDSAPLAVGAAPSPAVVLYHVYLGTYTSGDSQGIYCCRFDASSGQLSPPELAAATPNPSFLAIHPNQRFLYAVNEMTSQQDEGLVTAYRIDATSGRLSQLHQQSSRGGLPCHLVVDAGGRHVLAANYGTGSAIVFPVNDDGRLNAASSFVQHTGSSVNPRQQGPHAHSINLDAANRFAVVADLGLDQVLVYRYDQERGTLTANDPPGVDVAPGDGPRHFAFHPSGRFAYVINEIASTVRAFRYDASVGVLTSLQTISTLPPGGWQDGQSTAEVQVHPSGKFLYGSNRGHDSIVVYRIDPDRGTLTYVENESTQGKTPRNFGIEPGGRFLLAANQSSDSIVVFRINAETGALEPTGGRVQVPNACCVKFLPITSAAN